MKCGLKTVPLAVDDDDRIKLIEAEYGLKGWAVMYKLYQYIAAHGYYLKWDIDTQFLFIRDKCLSAVGQSAVSEIVACALRRGVFDVAMYEKHGILTSNHIQETFLTATKRNTKVVFNNEYCLPVVYEFIRNASKKGKNVNIFLKNADISEQKKGKEKKGKEKKGVAESGLSDADYDELVSNLGKTDTDYYMQRIIAFKKKKPEATFETKATILKWAREDKAGDKGRAGGNATAIEKTYTAEALNAMFDNLSDEDL